MEEKIKQTPAKTKVFRQLWYFWTKHTPSVGLIFIQVAYYFHNYS